MLSVLGTTAAGLAALVGTNTARAAQNNKHQVENLHAKCAKAYFDCEATCSHAFQHCYKQVQADKQDHLKAMHMCVDCGDVCSTSGKLVARMSPLMAHTCLACAQCCEACIEACKDVDAPDIKEFVGALRNCPKSCCGMVQAMGGR